MADEQPSNGIQIGADRTKGAHAAARGPLAIVTLMALVMVTAAFLFVYYEMTVVSREREKVVEAITRELQGLKTTIEISQKELNTSLERNICVNLMPQDVKMFAASLAKNKRNLDDICAWLRQPHGPGPTLGTEPK